MKKALLLLFVSYFSFGALQCMAQEHPVTSTTSLSAQETQALLAAGAQAPSLLEQSAGGCRTVWDNDTQQNKEICYSPVGMGVAGGMMGGLLGSFWGIAGAAAGAVSGGLLLGVLAAVVYSD
jgi:hypothetical protein